MGSIAILMAGIATGFNAIIIIYKLQKGDTTNAAIDSAVLAAVMWLFSGTLGALVVGTIASAIFSVYLLVQPVEKDVFSKRKH